MSKEEIIKKMIIFIEEKEREFQSETLISDNRIKNDVVKSILNELENVIKDDN